MVDKINSLKKVAAFIVFVIISALVTQAIFELFIVGPTNTPAVMEQLGLIIITFAFTAIGIGILLRLKSVLTPRIGVQAATILQYTSSILAALVATFVILSIFDVNVSTLVTSAGIISVTAGLLISTFVGGILSGR